MLEEGGKRLARCLPFFFFFLCIRTYLGIYTRISRIQREIERERERGGGRNKGKEKWKRVGGWRRGRVDSVAAWKSMAKKERQAESTELFQEMGEQGASRRLKKERDEVGKTLPATKTERSAGERERRLCGSTPRWKRKA